MKYWLWLATYLLLAACSGGSDGGSGSDNEQEEEEQETTQVERVSLTGLAVKGLARKAKVEAFTLSGNNFTATADAVTSTNSEGRYSIVLPESLGDYSGPLKVRLSYQSGAEIQCDVQPTCQDGSVNFGDFYGMPETFELTAVVNVGSGLTNDSGETIANVSSLTTLATNFLTREGNTISSTTLKTSNNQVRAIFSLPKSVDLVATEPQVVTSDDVNGDEVYGAVNAAFLKLSEDNNESLASVLSDVSDQLIANNGQVYQKAPDNDATAPSIFSISTAADAYLSDGQLDSVITQADQASAGSLTSINPPSISAGADKTVNAGSTVTIPLEFILPEGGESALTNPQYLWQVISGPLELLTNNTATTNTLVFTAPNDGGVIKLRALIEAGEGSDNDIVIVNVNALTTADTSRSGSYLNSGANLGFLGGGSLFGFDHEVYMDEYDLTFNADGSGIAARNIGNDFAYYENSVNLSQVGLMTLNQREFGVGTVPSGETGQFSFQQLASGGLVISVPGYTSEEVSETDSNVIFREQSVSRQIRFYDFGGGLYVANPFFYESVTKIVGGVQEAEPFDIRIGSELLSMHKANAISNVSEFSNKSFIGFQWWLDMDDSAPSFVSSVVKSEFTFNADGTQAAVNEDVYAISGVPNADHNAGNTVYTIASSTTTDTLVTTDFNLASGRLTLGANGNPQGDIVTISVADDFSAMFINSFSYSNDAGTTFDSAEASTDELGQGVLIAKPTTPADLDGRVYDVTFQSYRVDNPNIGSVVAPAIGLTNFKGQFTITDGEIKIAGLDRFSEVRYPSGLVDGSTADSTVEVDVDYKKVATGGYGAVKLVSTTQDVNGCLQEDGGNLEICVSDNGSLIGYMFDDFENGTEGERMVARLVGKQVGTYTAPTIGFTNTSLSGLTFTLNFTDGNATYIFNADKSGQVTWPDTTVESLEWLVDAKGRIIADLDGGERDRYTLTAGTAASGTVSLEIDAGAGFVVQESELNRSWTQQ